MRFDLNKLMTDCQNRGVSFNCYYEESSDCLSIEICSASEQEEFYMKRVPNIEFFIEKYIETLKSRGLHV